VLQYPHQVEHKLQQIIDARAEVKKIADLEAEVKAAGVKLVARPTAAYSSDPKNKHKYLVSLVDKESGKKITPAEHASCEGHAAYVGKPGGYDYGREIEIRYVCTDPAKYGHRDSNRTAPAVLTDAEKAQRKVALERGKLWPSIVTVRTTWIREQLLTRKTMPPAWEQLVARVTLNVIAARGDEYIWKSLAHDLLQIEKTGYGLNAIESELEAKPAHAEVLLVGIAIARVESVLDDKKGWQSASPMYLQLLEAWGYKLSDLEQEIVAAPKGKKAA